MKMMLRLGLLAFFVTLGMAATDQKANLDHLIDEVFSKKGQGETIPNEKPCNKGLGECVPYYLVRKQ